MQTHYKESSELWYTFTGWKNSSMTFCALKSSDVEQTPAGTDAAAVWAFTPELLGGGACRFWILLWVPVGDLNSLHVKMTATAKPAMAPTDREF